MPGTRELAVALCDDSPEMLARTRAVVESSLAGRPHRTEAFTRPADLLAAADSRPFDLAVLDIQMPGEDGIALGRQLLDRCPGCRILFLTAYMAYCQDVYDVDHAGFVLKEEMESRLPHALTRVLRRLEEPAAPAADRLLMLGDPGNACQLPQGEILYLEHQGRTTWVYTLQGRLACAEKLETLLARLDPVAFCQTHKSYAVHWPFAQRYDKQSIRLTGGAVIPVSRNYRAAVRRSFLAYAAALQSGEETPLP